MKQNVASLTVVSWCLLKYRSLRTWMYKSSFYQKNVCFLWNRVNCVLIIVTWFLILPLFFFFFYFTLFLRQVFTWMVVLCFKRECLICASLVSDKRYQVGPTFLVSGINKIQIIIIQSNKEKKNNSKSYIHITIERKKRKSIL